ncbi:MAG: hypothetical protein D6696_16820 [Acidobacteria bacterium]|nr:MAG: hypothetical protein D6696_16820 [Acidobacteriota bacterium]
MLNWLQGDDVNALIAKKHYRRALKLLERQLRENPRSVQLRLLKADVLSRLERDDEAVEVLRPMVDEFVSDGFVAKAIAVLKKIQRIEPERGDIADQLAALVQGQQVATMPNPDVPLIRAVETDGELVSQVPGTAGDAPPTPLPGTSEMVLPERWFEQAATHRDDFHWSPLFSDFSRSELAAVIGGLRLLVKYPGAIIFTEEEPGDSLFILSTGTARVYRRDAIGHNRQIAILKEGEFFGAASVLRGAPRTVTVTAATECELLELDRITFDGIAAAYPRVRELVQQFYDQHQAHGGIDA